MMPWNGRNFLIVDNTSFDLLCEGRRMDEMKICENSKGFLVSILLVKKEVN